jgi:GNAT superfamily N-acetyltransferase
VWRNATTPFWHENTSQMTPQQPSHGHGDSILHDLMIVPFQPENQAAVKRLILAGLTEHWGQLDPTKNPDLDDIGATYAHATFLVAWWHGTIVGTGALLPRSAHSAEIVRMSVAAHMRRHGIGTRLLQRLVAHAQARGYRRLILETTATWHEVIAFYQRNGFQITHCRDGDVYFRLDLVDPAGQHADAGERVKPPHI